MTCLHIKLVVYPYKILPFDAHFDSAPMFYRRMSMFTIENSTLMRFKAVVVEHYIGVKLTEAY